MCFLSFSPSSSSSLLIRFLPSSFSLSALPRPESCAARSATTSATSSSLSWPLSWPLSAQCVWVSHSPFTSLPSIELSSAPSCTACPLVLVRADELTVFFPFSLCCWWSPVLVSPLHSLPVCVCFRLGRSFHQQCASQVCLLRRPCCHGEQRILYRSPVNLARFFQPRL